MDVTRAGARSRCPAVGDDRVRADPVVAFQPRRVVAVQREVQRPSQHPSKPRIATWKNLSLLGIGFTVGAIWLRRNGG